MSRPLALCHRPGLGWVGSGAGAAGCGGVMRGGQGCGRGEEGCGGDDSQRDSGRELFLAAGGAQASPPAPPPPPPAGAGGRGAGPSSVAAPYQPVRTALTLFQPSPLLSTLTHSYISLPLTPPTPYHLPPHTHYHHSLHFVCECHPVFTPTHPPPPPPAVPGCSASSLGVTPSHPLTFI